MITDTPPCWRQMMPRSGVLVLANQPSVGCARFGLEYRQRGYFVNAAGPGNRQARSRLKARYPHERLNAPASLHSHTRLAPYWLMVIVTRERVNQWSMRCERLFRRSMHRQFFGLSSALRAQVTDNALLFIKSNVPVACVLIHDLW